jgi:hypothetical protein
MRLGRRTITVVTPATVTTDWGLQLRSLLEVDGATRRRVSSCAVQEKPVAVPIAGLTLNLTGATAYAPAGSQITNSDAIEVDGATYAVDGDPVHWVPRSGRGRVLVLELAPWEPLTTLWRHDTTVERLQGQGPKGPVYATPTTVTGFVSPGVRMVRNASGEEVVSSTTIVYPIETAPIRPGSYITPPPALGVPRARVLTSTALAGAGLDTPDHLEVTLA